MDANGSTRHQKVCWLAPYLACRANGCSCRGWKRNAESSRQMMGACSECNHVATKHGDLHSFSDVQLDQILNEVKLRVSGSQVVLSEYPPFEVPSIEVIFQRYGAWIFTEGTGNEEQRGALAPTLRAYQRGCIVCLDIMNDAHFLTDLPAIVTGDPTFSPYYVRWLDFCSPGKNGRMTAFFGRSLLLHVAPLLRSSLVNLKNGADRQLTCSILAAVTKECMDAHSPILQRNFNVKTPRRGYVPRHRNPMNAGSVAPLAPLAAPPAADISHLLKIMASTSEDLVFRVVRNDNTPEALMMLASVKQIFSLQLPKMPREYITRLVFNKMHRSLVASVGERPIGGICFRPFPTQGFVEITFCAITTDRQVKGYGSMLMNHLKAYCQREQILYFLTYADSFATGYFKKQGFSDVVTLPRSKWAGFIKDYDGATLMECKLHPTLDYLTYGQTLLKQRNTLEEHIEQVIANEGHSYKGLSAFKSKRQKAYVEPEDIPGVVESGWDAELDALSGPGMEEQKMERLLEELLSRIKQHSYAWPFKGPVDKSEVPDYYDVIKDPVDLQMIEKRLKSKSYYVTVAIFVADLKRMVQNCKDYNDPHTSYYKCAAAIENFIEAELKRLKLDE